MADNQRVREHRKDSEIGLQKAIVQQRPIAAYNFSNVEDTKCPKLDCVIKQNLTKDVKDTNSNAARLQNIESGCSSTFGVYLGRGPEGHSHLPVSRRVNKGSIAAPGKCLSPDGEGEVKKGHQGPQ